MSYMIRKHGQLYLTTLFFLDAVAVTLSWLLAYFIRFKFELIAPSGPIPSENMYLYAMVPVWIVFLLNVRIFGFAYRSSNQSPLENFENFHGIVHRQATQKIRYDELQRAHYSFIPRGIPSCPRRAFQIRISGVRGSPSVASYECSP